MSMYIFRGKNIKASRVICCIMALFVHKWYFYVNTELTLGVYKVEFEFQTYNIIVMPPKNYLIINSWFENWNH